MATLGNGVDLTMLESNKEQWMLLQCFLNAVAQKIPEISAGCIRDICDGCKVGACGQMDHACLMSEYFYISKVNYCIDKKISKWKKEIFDLMLEELIVEKENPELAKGT